MIKLVKIDFLLVKNVFKPESNPRYPRLLVIPGFMAKKNAPKGIFSKTPYRNLEVMSL